MKNLVTILLTLAAIICFAAADTCDAGASRQDCGRLRNCNLLDVHSRELCPSPTGYLGINEQECEEKGCCWSPADVRLLLQ